MKRILMIVSLSVAMFLFGCSKGEPEELSSDELEGLPIEEQVELIVENTNLIEEEYEIIYEENSVAIVYATDYIGDNTLVLDDASDSFPNVAMTLVEHLSPLNFDEIVVTSYDPKDEGVNGLTRVSALYKKDSIEEIDFEEWKEKKEKFPHRAYMHSDSYLIRGNVWDKLYEETKEAIGENAKRELNSGSEFWEYYGRHVE